MELVWNDVLVCMYVKRWPYATLSMEKGQAGWAKGSGPYNGHIFPTSQAKLARVTPSCVYYCQLIDSAANITLGIQMFANY